MGLPSHQHQNPNTIPSHQHRIQVPSHPISTRLPLPSHPIYIRRRLPSHPINAFLRVSHPIPSHQCISSYFPSHRITIIKESDSHPIFVMVKLKKIPACGGLSDGIPSHVVPSAPRMCFVCVCVFSSHPFWTSSSLDVPAGVTQEEGHTGFLIHLPSAVRALIFVARRIQPFLSLVDREVEFCVLTN